MLNTQIHQGFLSGTFLNVWLDVKIGLGKVSGQSSSQIFHTHLSTKPSVGYPPRRPRPARRVRDDCADAAVPGHGRRVRVGRVWDVVPGE